MRAKLVMRLLVYLLEYSNFIIIWARANKFDTRLPIGIFKYPQITYDLLVYLLECVDFGYYKG